MASGVALIIPSLDGQLDALLASVAMQTLQPDEVEIVRAVRPNGRARNLGVARSQAPILVFVDDDAVLGNQYVLERLVAALADARLGVVGASKLLPPNAPAFQRWVARELPRIEHAVVDQPLESNPDPPSFYCEITTTCCAMRRAVFEQVGGFDERLVRGVDTEFFVRVRRMPAPDRVGGHYRFLLVPQTWAYHPAPATLMALLRKQFWYGAGHAQEVRRDPARARGRQLHTPVHALTFVLLRTLLLPINVFVPYSYAAPSWRPGFKPLKALASYVSALGYVWGWYYLEG